MIKLSRMADYAVVVTSSMARDDRPLMCVQDLADSTGLSTPTVSKILKLLVKANIVRSERGAHGGYGLAEVPKNIPILHIIEAIDGSVALTDCADQNKEQCCSIESVCNTRPHWNKLNGIIRNALLSATLDEFAAPVIHSMLEVSGGSQKADSALSPFHVARSSRAMETKAHSA